jgi:hypothetical protein
MQKVVRQLRNGGGGSRRRHLAYLGTTLGEFGCAAAGENRATTPVLADDGGVTRRNLLEGIVAAACIYTLVLLQGKP